MTTLFQTAQFPILINGFIPSTKQTINLFEGYHNSGRTTRSGTPDSKDNCADSECIYESPIKSSIVEIGVKPKRKLFNTEEERSRFVQNYKRKIKTELCKNFELRGWCKFGDNCSFAHGKHELQEKTHLHLKYKTKPCQQFHESGHCNYGNRCQYLHAEAIMPNIFHKPTLDTCASSNKASYSYPFLQELFKLAASDCKVEKILSKIPKKTRLPVFQSIVGTH